MSKQIEISGVTYNVVSAKAINNGLISEAV